jgi:large subunit ribosomal protein L25
VIPRDFKLDPVRDNPIHVDFMRLGEGAVIRVAIPVHVVNTELAPGVKRGGTVNIVTHTIDVQCKPEAIPVSIDVDVAELEINHSKHLSDITFPPGIKPISRIDLTPVTIVRRQATPRKVMAEVAAAAARRRRRCCWRCSGRRRCLAPGVTRARSGC